MKKKVLRGLGLLLVLLVCMSSLSDTDSDKPNTPTATDEIVSSDAVGAIEGDDPYEGTGSQNELPEENYEAEAETIVEEPAILPDTPGHQMVPVDSTFEVHYIDVGQGDCSLILCDGRAMLIDGGEASESSKVYAYLRAHNVKHLDYIVASHAHSDHIGGLSGALNYATVDIALCPVTEYDSKSFESFEKYLNAQSVNITVPCVGDVYSLGSATVQVLGPQKRYDEINDTSIVLKVTYGQTSFLFTGDAERVAEADILSAGYDLSSTVLKVGHHGSDTSTSYPFLREIMPDYAVIQVGEDNSYGHPTEDTLSRLRDADVTVYRNDLQGTIICSSDGAEVSFSTEKNEAVKTNPTVIVAPETETTDDHDEYIGNKNSKKFHLPSCKNLPAEKNRVYLDSRQMAIDGGFDPCGNCNP